MVIMTAIVFLIIMFGNKSLLLRSFVFFASFMMLRVKLVASFLLMLSVKVNVTHHYSLI